MTNPVNNPLPQPQTSLGKKATQVVYSFKDGAYINLNATLVPGAGGVLVDSHGAVYGYLGLAEGSNFGASATYSSNKVATGLNGILYGFAYSGGVSGSYNLGSGDVSREEGIGTRGAGVGLVYVFPIYKP